MHIVKPDTNHSPVHVKADIGRGMPVQSQKFTDNSAGMFPTSTTCDKHDDRCMQQRLTFSLHQNVAAARHTVPSEKNTSISCSGSQVGWDQIDLHLTITHHIILLTSNTARGTIHAHVLCQSCSLPFTSRRQSCLVHESTVCKNSQHTARNTQNHELDPRTAHRDKTIDCSITKCHLKKMHILFDILNHIEFPANKLTSFLGPQQEILT